MMMMIIGVMLELTMPFQDYKIVSFSSISEPECFTRSCDDYALGGQYFLSSKHFKTQFVLHGVNKLILFCS